MNDYAQIKPIVAADPWRLLSALGVKEVRGRGWCPFCQADGRPHRSPDFGLRPDGGGWKCHRCGAKGDWPKLVRELCKVGFADAVRYIAATYGLATADDIAVSAARAREAKPARRRERRRYDTLADALRAVQAALARQHGGEWNVVGIWHYTDDLVQVRFQCGPDKEYRPMTREDGKWTIGAPRVKPWPLYRIDEAIR